MQKVSPRAEGANLPGSTILPSTDVVGAGQRETPGNGQPAKVQPGGTSRGEPNKGVQVVEDVGGRGTVSTGNIRRPGEVEGTGRPGVGTSGLPGLEAKPTPEGLSERETVTLEPIKKIKHPTEITG